MSDAYATGQALVALRESGVLKTSDGAYKKGAQLLIDTQLEDGSWRLRSRSIAVILYFESGFPHGRDQFISANHQLGVAGADFTRPVTSRLTKSVPARTADVQIPLARSH